MSLVFSSPSVNQSPWPLSFACQMFCGGLIHSMSAAFSRQNSSGLLIERVNSAL
jgi:hypothetical protein